MTWLPGIPKEKGIYWFDVGYNQKPHLILKIAGNEMIYTDVSSMPLDCVYDSKCFPKARCQAIELPKNKWLPFSKVKNTKRMWIKSTEGYVGFYSARHNTHGLNGNIVWLSHPTNSAHCGLRIDYDSKWKFQPVELP